MTENEPWKRRLPIGAEVQAGGGVHFRVWAPDHQQIHVAIEPSSTTKKQKSPLKIRLKDESNGYFSGYVAEARAGDRYYYMVDRQRIPCPDPASRFQPEGPHGPSEVIDPGAFRWTDAEWKGIPREGQVLYEMHIGTFTREGTWTAAVRELKALGELGVTALELMPVADFAGRFGWGYDSVDLFAPTRLYGRPDEFRKFVNEAHAIGLGVILDVVYNHLGPDGNYLKQFSDSYFSKRYATEWGEAINYDDRNSEPVREFFSANASYWIDEFHLDGLRIDATQNIYDSGTRHILGQLGEKARLAGNGRMIYLVGENEPQEMRCLRPTHKGGFGLDALWNDDFHHSAMVAMTGRNEAYYTDYRGSPQEFISSAKYGYLYQGQYYAWQKKRRGTLTFGLPASSFVNFIQNHDQIANSGRGLRCHALTSPGLYRAMTALFLLSPGTPMLFQGQEFAASSPFFYFADHKPELAKLVCKGRAEFLSQFRSLASPAMQACLPDPGATDTFERSKLDFSERERHSAIYALHRDLLALRKNDPAFQQHRRNRVDGAVLAPEAFVLRYFAGETDDRLLLVNFGLDLKLLPAPEPLLAPAENCIWTVLWSSEDPAYEGGGTAPLDTDAGWMIPGHAAVVLKLQSDYDADE